MSSIEQVLLEAVTTDHLQVILVAGERSDAFDACLERVLQQQLRLDAEGVVRSWLRTQLMVPVRMPKSRSPIEAFYRQIVRKAGPETLASFFPDLHLKHHRRDINDPTVRALVLLSEAVLKGYSELRQELFAYLLTERSQEALAEIGLSENLEHLDDKLFVLSTILQCMIGVKALIGTGGAVGPACRVYLMLSELEHLLTLPGEIAWAFLHALESLSHDVGPGLTIWMQSTTIDTTAMQQLEKRFGSRLLQEWITHRWLE
jgi:hypothetical protein